MSDLTKMYKTIKKDSFPAQMEISFIDESQRQTLSYQRVTWNIGGEDRGLRYGENPSQPAALYKLVNGNLTLGEVKSILPGKYLASDVELIQSGKHPGKINITDIDNALNILRYLDDPATVIVKHNNPCGVAIGNSLANSYDKAYMADRIAAFGGAIALNRAIDIETAQMIASSYSEVVAAPEFEPGVMEIFAKKKNLRVMKIDNIARLKDFRHEYFVDYKSLIDGGLAVQWSFAPEVKSIDDFLKAESVYQGKSYSVNREATDQEKKDMLFGWLVESGVTSNSVLFVKDGATVGIGTGEQDRVGVAEIARDKAYRKAWDRLSFVKYGTPWALLDDEAKREEILAEVAKDNAGLKGSVMVSDAFFPFRDGIEIGLKEGVSAVIQPGGSLRDFESIEACNEFNAAMVYTGERSFKH
ncbi:MAG: IMP cyclohydrolase [Spirochaetales bacterium]|nr:IMP cyclohydrolase [Spirochaetales bacterium]